MDNDLKIIDDEYIHTCLKCGISYLKGDVIKAEIEDDGNIIPHCRKCDYELFVSSRDDNK